MGLYETFRSVAARRTDAPALTTLEATVTYGALLEMIDRVSRGLLRAGVRPGDRVGILSGSRPEIVAAYYACFRIGAVIVPINPKLSPAEIAELIEVSGAAYGVADATVHGTCADRLGRTDALRRIWLLPGEEGDGDLAGGEAWTDLTAEVTEADPAGLNDPGGEALAAIFYTSGTTGLPKGITYTHDTLAAGAALAGHQGAGRGPGTFPLFDLIHAWATVALLATFERGQSFVLSASFAPDAVLNLLRARPCSWVAGVPSSYRSLVEFASLHRSALDLGATMFVVGGDACPADVKRGFAQLFEKRLLNSYGSSELGGPTMLQPDRDFDDPAVIGAALPGIDFQIKDPIDGIGELLIRSPARPPGVWDGAAVDRHAQSDWFATGDLVHQDDKGLLYFMARAKDIIKVNGISVSPQDVERALANHPSVAAALVFGVDDAKDGEAPIALVKLRPGAAADPDELHRHLVSLLASYKIPREIQIVEAVPLTPAGKVGRRQLAAAYVRQRAPS